MALLLGDAAASFAKSRRWYGLMQHMVPKNVTASDCIALFLSAPALAECITHSRVGNWHLVHACSMACKITYINHSLPYFALV